MSGLPALLRSPVSASDQISIVKNPQRVCYMILNEYESGVGRLFKEESIAKSFAGGRQIVKVKIEKLGE